MHSVVLYQMASVKSEVEVAPVDAEAGSVWKRQFMVDYIVCIDTDTKSGGLTGASTT